MTPTAAAVHPSPEPGAAPPMVSIGIPVYNGEKYLRDAVDSVLSQDFRDLELVISDNASTDGTQAICEAYAKQDPRVRYHRNPENLGLSRNFSHVLSMARGTYFSWLAHDDSFASPAYLSTLITYLHDHPDTVLCSFSVQAFDAENPGLVTEIVLESLLPDQDWQKGRLDFFWWPQRATHWVVYGVFRREALLQCPIRQRVHRGKLVAMDMEYTILSRLCQLGRIVALPQTLKNSRSVSTSAASQEMERFSTLDYFWLALTMKLALLKTALLWKLPLKEKLTVLKVALGNFVRAPLGQRLTFIEYLTVQRKEIALLRKLLADACAKADQLGHKIKQMETPSALLALEAAGEPAPAEAGPDPLYEQESELEIILALGAHCERRTFVDVGAEKGAVARKLMEAGFHGTLFEPFPDHHDDLEKLVAGTASKIYSMAVGALDCEALLHIAKDADGRTMDYFHSLHRDDANPIAQHEESIPVVCRSLDSLAKEGLVDPALGILKIDTEGTDLNVIRGMGSLTAEVLVCEFVTPSLYPTWAASFPEALVEAAFARGYEECIAIKRCGSHEMVTFGPPVFSDGQWGNLIFTSTTLLSRARADIQSLAQSVESRLASSFTKDHQSLAEKEAVIQDLVRALKLNTRAGEELKQKLQKQKTKETELRARIDKLKSKARS